MNAGAGRTPDTGFATAAGNFLSTCAGAVEDLLGQSGVDGDVDLDQGILSVTIAGVGVFVLSPHAPTRQLWLSSPLSGGSHYVTGDGQTWTGTRGEGDLWQKLAGELRTRPGEAGAPDATPA